MTRRPDEPRTPPADKGLSLKRWSRRKLAAARAADAPTALPEPEPVPGSVVPPVGGLPTHHPVAPAAPPAIEPALPPVSSLTFDSDFRAFMQPHVAELLKRQALRKLLHDPRFNVMDGLDVYIDDYSIPSPLEPELVREMVQARYIFDPPPTRVNAAGHVEDVPPEGEAHVPASSVATPEAATDGGPGTIEEAPAGAAASPELVVRDAMAVDPSTPPQSMAGGADQAAPATPLPDSSR